MESLIKKHLQFYKSLDSGERKPTTKAQVRFVGVCRGELPPVTQHEKAYISYRNRQARVAERRLDREGLADEFRAERIDRVLSRRPKKKKRRVIYAPHKGPGLCNRCGEAIPARRLEAVPGTKLCIGCQRAEEI